ncbi:MAG: hypothetical protein H8E38_05170 [SAR324 cluster bacterium]|nr:hypothetical protein [SAR324 cluster bacterium]MBL7034097.1 hypothetical protein [SAR324 cluster bacterium]
MKNIILLLLLTTLLTGCYPDSLNFRPGWATRWIEGSLVEDSGTQLNSKPFIIVLEYYSQFIQFENESPLYAPKARLVFPDEAGRFRLSFNLEASAIELVFIASGYNMQRFRFQRQIGIGELNYHAGLQRSEVWRSHFLLQTAPFLDNFILEQHYQMPDSQQQFIGDWLGKEREKFAQEQNT